MALKFKAKVNSTAVQAVERKLKKLAKPLDTNDYQKMGRAVIKVMKGLISKGISTVRGGGFGGKFPRYKRQGDPKGYPANVKKKYPSKKQRPVNLKLSGDFLSALKFRVTTKGLDIGFFNKKQSKKEDGHRNGVNGQPKRPTIPIKDNERFAEKIEVAYLKIAQAKIKRITKKKN